MGIQKKDTEMKGSEIVVFFGGILLIGLSFGQPIQESEGEDLTTWDEFNQKIAHDAVEVEAMLDENKDEKISETEFKEELEKLEAVIGLGGSRAFLDEFNQKMAQIAVNLESELDEDKDGKISETDFKKDLEKLETFVKKSLIFLMNLK